MINVSDRQTELRDEFKRCLPLTLRGVASVYDVTSRCNLTCDGCFYFSRDSQEVPVDTRDLAPWRRLLQEEAHRGVNMAIVSGAEPSLRPEVLKIIADFIPTGIIFTNGTKYIPKSVDYRIAISLWGNIDTGTSLRGANVVEKAFKNYKDDHRSIFLYTINSQNINEISSAVEMCERNGQRISFQYYSPTHMYLQHIQGQAITVDPRYHHPGKVASLQLTKQDQQRADAIIQEMLAKHTNTIVYSNSYNSWMGNPEKSPYTISTDGIAVDCEQRVSRGFRHYNADATRSHAKCGHGTIDCKTCRAVPGGVSSYLRHNRPRMTQSEQQTIEKLENWLEVFKFWFEFFIGHQSPSFNKAISERNRLTGSSGN